MTVFALVTEASKKSDNVILNWISYIYYSLRFYKNKKNEVRALINFDSKINILISAYALKLNLKICLTGIRA